MRSFENIAKLIKTKRIQHPKGYSQSELSHLLGYKNGQFISNVERALCNIPLKMLNRVCEILDIDRNELRDAILKDHEITLNNYLENGSGVVGGGQTNAAAPQLNMEASANTNTATMY
ncbi:MAG: helix-turn-helix transcriptional regulator [Bdellovibrionota bacterium]|nr:helix-turn-helix transcriptional regulator [Bdellovibrionota bacterium]